LVLFIPGALNHVTLSNSEGLVWSQESHAGLTQAEKSRITSHLSRLHIPFIANEGQVSREVKYYARTFGGTVFVTEKGEIVYSLPGDEKGSRDSGMGKEAVAGVALKEQFIGAQIKGIKGEGEAETKVSYFKGHNPEKWKGNLPTYAVVNLGEVYRGIELKLRAYGDTMEKLFYVEPYADPEAIQLTFSGAKRISVNKDGELEVETDLGPVKFTRPVAYQEVAGKRVNVTVAYNLLNSELPDPPSAIRHLLTALSWEIMTGQRSW
jgi:hypothetical protein